jgi:hypothetical protein
MRGGRVPPLLVSLLVVTSLTSGACRRLIRSSEELAAEGKKTGYGFPPDTTPGYFSALPSYEASMHPQWRAALFGGYERRLCELTWDDEERVVHAEFLVESGGAYEVVARSASRPETNWVVAARAPLDAPTGALVARLCLAALRLHDGPREMGADGTVYTAAHWTDRGLETGTTWSPDRGTVADGYVDLVEALAAYARTDGAARQGAHVALVLAAQELSRRLGLTR